MAFISDRVVQGTVMPALSNLANEVTKVGNGDLVGGGGGGGDLSECWKRSADIGAAVPQCVDPLCNAQALTALKLHVLVLILPAIHNFLPNETNFEANAYCVSEPSLFLV